jgi:pyrroloquinoline-quinone synthase
MSSREATEFLRVLNEEIQTHPFLSDPLVKRLSTPGAINRDQARTFAIQYYPHIFRTRLYQANALGIAPDETVQFALAEILYDEYGNGDAARTHPGVYRKFLRALDVQPREFSIEPGFPELSMYVDVMMRLTQSGDWLEAAAAVGIASEWPIPKYYAEILKGLRTVPGIKEDDLELFSSHIGIDEHHSELMRNALAPYAEKPDGRERIKRGVRINLDARRVMMNGLYGLVFGDS